MVDSEHIPLPPTTISGQVINTNTGNGVPNAKVPFTNMEGVDSVIAITDAEGKFKTVSAPGQYILTKAVVNEIEYPVTEQNVNVVEGIDTNVGVLGVSRNLTF